MKCGWRDVPSLTTVAAEGLGWPHPCTTRGRAGGRLDHYLESANEAYDLALRRFLYSNFDSVTSQLRWDVVARSPRLLRSPRAH